MFKLETSRTI